MNNARYREAVAVLNWAALASATRTRPDIAYTVSTVVRFSLDPGLAHWEVMKRIFRDLSGTRDLWRLTYGEKSRGLIGYTDSDANGSMDKDCNAISGLGLRVPNRWRGRHGLMSV